MKWIKEHAVDIISLLIGVGGVVATIIATQISESRDFFAVFVAVLAAEAVCLVAWIVALKSRLDFEKENTTLQNLLDTEKQENATLKKQFEELLNSHALECTSSLEKNQKQMKIMLLNLKNASKLNNELCNRIPGLSESSYKILLTLEEFPEIPPEKKKEAVIESRNEFSIGLFNLYKQYTSNLLTYTVTMVETYLKMFGKEREISATVKLFNEPYFTKNNGRKRIIVYTAFRDKKTYEAKKREIGVEPYSIDGNVDFSLCITQEDYFINNAVKGDPSYVNEHKDFDAYYNCAVVVPIRAKQEDGSFKILGYLCCDCLNSERNIDVFDKQVANLLFALAQLYATFLETLDSNWSDRFNGDSDDEGESFLHLIFDHVYKGKK